jgi:hypothetical protein
MTLVDVGGNVPTDGLPEPGPERMLSTSPDPTRMTAYGPESEAIGLAVGTGPGPVVAVGGGSVAGAVVGEGRLRVTVGAAGEGDAGGEVGEGRPEGVGRTRGVVGNGVGRLNKPSEQLVMVRKTNPATRIRKRRFIFLSFRSNRTNGVIVSRQDRAAVSAECSPYPWESA